MSTPEVIKTENIPVIPKEKINELNNKKWEGLNKNQKILMHIKKLLKVAKSKEFRKIKISNYILYQQKLREKFDQLDRFYPSLFRMAIDDPINFDMPKLKSMLSMKDNVENKKVSYEDANKKIGLQYYNEYIKKHVDNADPTDKTVKNNDLKNLFEKKKD